ncbi:MAG: hypothetical protein J6T71_05540 [Paludibacteraceae bacterium]|nr:hypothetical protein [Paludibacteraceae bacterium]
MKHVFGIASHLTFNVARKIIETDNIPAAQCCFVLLRNYVIPAEYQAKFKNQLSGSFNIDARRGRIFEGWRIWKTRQNMRTWDEQLSQLTDHDDFIWYTSICYNDICSMAVTNGKCQGYYVMEDGLVSYEDNTQTFTGWRYWVYRYLLLPLFPRIFILKNHMVTAEHPKFKGCIATSERCFPFYKQYLRVIGSPFEPKPYTVKPDAVISVDPLFFKGIENDQVEVLYKRVAAFVKAKRYSCVAFKFHPRFETPNNRAYRDFYRAVLLREIEGIVELPQEVVLENLLVWCKADFYSFDSSVALYASKEGCTCYSLMPLVQGTPAYHYCRIMEEISETIH